MLHRGPNRRQFLQTAAAAGAATLTPYWFTSRAGAQDSSKSDRHTIGCIGTGDRWHGAIGPQVKKFGDIVAVCDVDKNHLEKNGLKVAGDKAEAFEDYRRILDRKDIDIVTVVTPDHWHSKILIEAMQAGKDVYCEKPMTLTIDEGKKICQVQKQTGRVVQVGTQQRDEFQVRQRILDDNAGKESKDAKDQKDAKDSKDAKNAAPTKLLFDRQFLQAVAMAHSGRLGNVQRAKIVIRANPVCPALPKVDVPAELNWELWQGQAPVFDFVQGTKGQSSNRSFPAGRTHYEFRWWYEYSGGKLTDWGAHHVDIAQWALQMDHSGPTSIESTGEMPVPYENGFATVHDQYNCPRKFNVVCKFPNGTELTISSGSEDSIWIEGDKGQIKVSRDTLKDISGDAVAGLADNPIPQDVLIKLCKGKKLPEHGTEGGTHMANFIECVRDRSLPISDVFTHHRAISTCHLANISLRLNRTLKWDPDKEEIVGDTDANNWLAREQRKGYEIKV
ncbi:MAG TPA: Gfo/Idh/MocA family oxidoreductase [Pirellulales bacterium]|jgi:predicted dehydrogenase|nr:Gfo/Idh/MocA family oxidoreductase [Pirellulales bacterium]